VNVRSASIAVMLAIAIGGVADAAPKRRPRGKTPKTPVEAPAPTPEPPPPAPEPPPTPEVTAPPANKKMVAILDVRLDGMSDMAGAELQKELDSQLDTTSYWLPSRQRVKERLAFSTKWSDGCYVGDCLKEVKTQVGADLALLIAISGQGTSFGYVISLMRTDNGTLLMQDAGRCDVCVEQQVVRDVTLATIDLLNKVPDKLPDREGDRAVATELAVGKLVARINTDEHSARKKAIVITVVGLVVAAGGAALYFAADKPEYAVGVMGAGGGLTLGGIALLSF
jgi:hypothetical protein